MFDIAPTGPAISGVPPEIKTLDDAIGFFNDDRTREGLTVLLDMTGAEDYRSKIEALITLFKDGKKLAATISAQAK